MSGIWLVAGEYPPLKGGLGDYTRRLAQAMAGQGIEVRVITRGGTEGDPPRDPGVEVDTGLPGFGADLMAYFWRRLGRERPDVLHIQYQAAAYQLRGGINLLPHLVRLRARRTLRAVTFHDLRLPYLFPGARPLRGWAVRTLARGSRLAVATNRGDEAQLQAWLPAQRVLNIPIGSNIQPEPLPDWDEVGWRRERGLPPRVPLLVFFGFLNQSKGVEDLLQAVRLLRAQGRSTALVLMGDLVGSSDPTNVRVAEGIRRRIGELGLDEQVFFTGYLDPRSISQHFAAATLAVLPYRDGISLRRGTLMAALAHGVPTLSTLPQTSEPALRQGHNIAFAPAADPVALAREIARLLDDRDLRRRLARGARELAEEFAWERLARLHLEAYQRVGNCRTF